LVLFLSESALFLYQIYWQQKNGRKDYILVNSFKYVDDGMFFVYILSYIE
jgi:hypothetical protein